MTADRPTPGAPDQHDEPLSPLDEAKDWVRAVALGVGDTLKDMLAAGRKGAREATDRYWLRFDEKTRRRREPRDEE